MELPVVKKFLTVLQKLLPARNYRQLTLTGGPLPPSVKRQTTADNLLLKDRKERLKMPTLKTAHLQAPSHNPMLQLAKEQFSYRRTQAHPPPRINPSKKIDIKSCVFKNYY